VSDRKTALTAAALAIGSVALYVQSLSFGFVRYDDQTVLQGHPALYDERSLWASMRESLRYLPREEPLLVRDVSWAIDSRLFGFTNPFGYHLGNVVLNACNAALLFLLLQHATRRYAFAATASALWVCLPLHVEPVCWVMGRKDLLAATFCLLMFLAQSFALRPGLPRHGQRLAGVAVLALYPLAVLSKFSAVTMVGALAVQRALALHLSGDVAPSAPVSLHVAARKSLGLWPHALVGGALYAWYSRQVGAFGVTSRGPGALDLRHLGVVAERAPLVLGIYLRNLVTASRHAIFYDWPSAGIALTTGQRIVSASIAVGVIVAVVGCARTRKDLLFYVLVFAALMATYLNIVYVGIWVADRYLYLASFCIVALVVQLGEDAVRGAKGASRERVRRAAPWAAAVAALAALAYAAWGITATLDREPAFYDAASLWAYEVGRPDPSMLAMQAYAKVRVIDAEQARDPVVREAFVHQATEAIARATEHYKATPWLPIGRYVVDAHAEYGTVLILRGRAAALAGESDAAQLRYYREAFAFSGNWTAAFLSEQVLYREADQQNNVTLARQALESFGQVVGSLAHDAARREALRERLEVGYRQRFPALSPAVDAIEHRWHL
jgi:hypothetical protein